MADGALIKRGIRVEPEWIDYNGHLNMAYYVVIFDRATDGLIARVGLSGEPGAGATIFALETQVRYLAEVPADAILTCETSVLGVDDKRLHSWQVLRHADGRVAATSENLHLHVERREDGPRVAAFAPDVRSSLERMRMPAMPEGAGRRIASRMASGR